MKAPLRWAIRKCFLGEIRKCPLLGDLSLLSNERSNLYKGTLRFNYKVPSNYSPLGYSISNATKKLKINLLLGAFNPLSKRIQVLNEFCCQLNKIARSFVSKTQGTSRSLSLLLFTEQLLSKKFIRKRGNSLAK